LAASYFGHVKVVERLLIQEGIDVTLQDYELEKGDSPLKCNCLVFAILNGHTLVIYSLLVLVKQSYSMTQH